MTREVRILTWCDLCAAAGEQAPGATYTPNHGRRSLDLCGEHAQLVEQLEQWLAAHGVTDAQAPRKAPRKASQAIQAAGAAMMAPEPQDGSEGFPCLLCGSRHRNSSAMGAHLARVHGLGVADVYGSSCPVCGISSAGTHIGRMHKVESAGQGIVGALAWALANGDPHGVASSQLALAAARKAS